MTAPARHRVRRTQRLYIMFVTLLALAGWGAAAGAVLLSRGVN